MFFSGPNTTDIVKLINDELKNLVIWLETNRLSLNIKKTNYMIFSRKKTKLSHLEIKINNIHIDRVTNTAFLGVLVDEQLNWKNHVYYICRKLAKCTGIIIKARPNLPKRSLITLYHTFAYPYFTYCVHVWGDSSITNQNKLTKYQKKLVRIITGSSYIANTLQLFNETRILKVHEVYKYFISIFMYKYHNNLLPNLFENMFILQRNIHTYNTRQYADYKLPLCSTNRSQKAIRFAGPKVWNSLSETIRSASSVESFKKKVKQLYIAQYT